MTRSRLLLLMALATGCAAAEARPPIVFDHSSLLRHRLQGETSIASPGISTSQAEIMVTISPQGDVVAAEADAKRNSEGVDPAPAIAAARRWKFRPFRYRGQAVPARGTVTIAYRPAPRWRGPGAGLPPIDYPSLRISLVRSACFGSCPDYSVTIDGGGGVFFTTHASALKGSAEAHRKFGPRGGVLLAGEHRSRIDRKALDALIERFRAARFFGLEPEYRAPVTDLPTHLLKFETGGRSWTVTDYAGQLAGMPPVVSELQKAVDEAAGTARWVTGDRSSIDSLKAEGFDFGSQQAAEFAAFLALTGTGDDGLIVGLLEAGVSPDRPMVFDSGEAPRPLGESLLVGAVGRHRPALFAWLAKRGWLARVPRGLLSQTFAEGGGGCDPAIARPLVAAGVDPKARAPRGERAGATALITAVRHGACGEIDLKPVVDTLVALGVDINAADEAGETVLYGVEDPDLQEHLLAAGARADVRDKKGNSPVFSSWNDRIVLGLLDAGASPKGRYSDGKTLRRKAVESDMPSVLAWLDERRID